METTTKLNQIEAIKAEYQSNELLVQAALGITEMDYRNLVFETGCQYAEVMTDHDVWGSQILQSSKFFWQWWRNEWAKRDRSFLQNYKPFAKKHLLRQVYNNLHNPEIFKQDEINQRMYASLIGNVFAERRRAVAK